MTKERRRKRKEKEKKKREEEERRRRDTGQYSRIPILKTITLTKTILLQQINFSKRKISQKTKDALN